MMRAMPNLVTMLRLLAGPVGAWLLLSSASSATEADAQRLGLTAGLVFVLAAVSDGLDGWLARRLDARTALGALLDPIADKVLVLSYLFAFCVISGWMAWLVLPVAVIALRDAAVTLLRLRPRGAKAQALVVTEAAKAKTAAEMVVIALPFALILFGQTDVSRWFFYWVGGVWFVAALSAWTGWAYLSASLRRS